MYSDLDEAVARKNMQDVVSEITSKRSNRFIARYLRVRAVGMPSAFDEGFLSQQQKCVKQLLNRNDLCLLTDALAVITNHPDCFAKIQSLSNACKIIMYENERGYSLLHYAAAFGYADLLISFLKIVFRASLKRGVDAYVEAIQMAAIHGQDRLANALLIKWTAGILISLY